MKDNDIIKALECCSKPYCRKCPLYKNTINTKNCIIQLSTNALALINRQKAEIERLESMNQSKLDLIHDLRAELETAKAEAVREFAHELKERDGYDNHTFDDCASILVSKEYIKGRYEKINEIWNTIDKLLIEMVGDAG
jgi:hypothetical protein